MDGWIAFWKIACLVGFTAFYLLVAAILPLGARDLVRLFRHLREGGEENGPEQSG
jgi:hypothetical protein